MGNKLRPPSTDSDRPDPDLYGVTDWYVRSPLDWVVYWAYAIASVLARTSIVLVTLVLTPLLFFAGASENAFLDPLLGVFTAASVVPALLIAAYVWYSDVTTREPLFLLVGTFVFGVLFAGFAALLNSVLAPVQLLGLAVGIPLVGQVAFFYLVVGPVEESVKLLAVRLFAYDRARFDAVIDGAVYGAVAGLGFATIENALYISGLAGSGPSDPVTIGTAAGTTVLRSLAGPGHVIWSAFAGYYLGLAKYNRENAGPIVLKGLVVAAAIHATYNTLVGAVPQLIAQYAGVGTVVGVVAFVVAFDGFFGLLLFRKLRKYKLAHRFSADDEGESSGVETRQTRVRAESADVEAKQTRIQTDSSGSDAPPNPGSPGNGD